MSKLDEVIQINLRCTRRLQGRLERAAQRRNGSVNGEMVLRLEASFEAEDFKLVLTELAAEHAATIARQKQSGDVIASFIRDRIRSMQPNEDIADVADQICEPRQRLFRPAGWSRVMSGRGHIRKRGRSSWEIKYDVRQRRRRPTDPLSAFRAHARGPSRTPSAADSGRRRVAHRPEQDLGRRMVARPAGALAQPRRDLTQDCRALWRPHRRQIEPSLAPSCCSGSIPATSRHGTGPCRPRDGRTARWGLARTAAMPTASWPRRCATRSGMSSSGATSLPTSGHPRSSRKRCRSSPLIRLPISPLA